MRGALPQASWREAGPHERDTGGSPGGDQQDGEGPTAPWDLVQETQDAMQGAEGDDAGEMRGKDASYCSVPDRGSAPRECAGSGGVHTSGVCWIEVPHLGGVPDWGGSAPQGCAGSGFSMLGAPGKHLGRCLECQSLILTNTIRLRKRGLGIRN